MWRKTGQRSRVRSLIASPSCARPRWRSRAKARISLTTLRELQHNINPRRRRPQTLTALSEALGWPPDYLATTLHGGNAEPYADEKHDPVLSSLVSIERELGDLRDRVDRIERQLAGEGG